jgi:hypothetical protein
MILAVFVRRLRPGVSFADFKQAWTAAPNHFGRAVRVTHAQRLDDEREVVSYALIDASREEVAAVLASPRVAGEEQRRHNSIDEVIEATVVQGLYEVVDTTELS